MIQPIQRRDWLARDDTCRWRRAGDGLEKVGDLPCGAGTTRRLVCIHCCLASLAGSPVRHPSATLRVQPITVCSPTDRSVNPSRYAGRTNLLDLALLERWHSLRTGFRELTDRWLADVEAAAGRDDRRHRRRRPGRSRHDRVWLGYRDGECASARASDAVARLCGVIDRVRPDTALTSARRGGHPGVSSYSRST